LQGIEASVHVDWVCVLCSDADSSFTRMMMHYNSLSAESSAISRPKGLLSALDHIEVCFSACLQCYCY